MNFLTLFISLRCTQACAHCLYGCSPATGEHMPWDVFQRSIAIAKEKQISTLSFFGGEPLLNPQFCPMLQVALEGGFSVILATNCRPFVDKRLYTDFLHITKNFKDNIHIFTAIDKFHLKHFDPANIVNDLRKDNYKVSISDYTNETILLSEYNAHKLELRGMNTQYSCCKGNWTDYLGVLPDGGWTICPPSLEAFGNIFSNSLEEIVKFKQGLPLRYNKGCTECLRDFKGYRKEFEAGGTIRGENVWLKI